MKNMNTKKYIIVLILMALLLVIPLSSTSALDVVEPDYQSVLEVSEVTDGDITISELKFLDHSNTSTMSFGLYGKIVKNSYADANVIISTTYYDNSYNVVANTERKMTVNSKQKRLYYDLYNLDKINEGYSVSDIAYYSIDIRLNNDEVDSPITGTKPSATGIYRNRDYVIDAYDVKIVVNENNTFDITETITAYFNKYKHGIIRTIPLKNYIERLDGSTYQNRTQISNVKVDAPFSINKKDNYYNIQIGSPSYTVIGEKKYQINYTYNLGKDPSKDYDELYLNIIGNKWDTVIGNVTFTIVMPKDFDYSKLGFAAGMTGSTHNDRVSYDVKDNIITGSYEGILKEHEALTVRCELEEGYFVGAKLDIDKSTIYMIIIPGICLIISILLWFKYGKDDMVIETVEFYPPNGMNSAELGYLYRGYAINQDVTSLLIYLANKGYLQIKERSGRAIIPFYPEFSVKLLKNYDGYDKNERLFMDGLFNCRRGKTYSYLRIENNTGVEEFKNESVRGEVTASELYNKFYITMNEIKGNLGELKDKVFEKTASKTVFIFLMLIVSLLTIISIPIVITSGYDQLQSTIFLVLFYIPFYAVLFSKGIPLFVRIIWGIITFFQSFAVFLSLPLIPALADDNVLLFAFLIGLAFVIAMAFIIKNMSKRTKYGSEMLGKIRGFKRFLETAEKEKLEAMVLKNPSYFYDILPYTYVLGISDKWINKFESIAFQAPDWYSSNQPFSANNFNSFMNSTMKSAESLMSSRRSSSGSSSGGRSSSFGGSSGRSSGGGFSGGGSGGGGGSSW